jgi:hypothetical protein
MDPHQEVTVSGRGSCAIGMLEIESALGFSEESYIFECQKRPMISSTDTNQSAIS